MKLEICAEIGANHLGSLDRAMALVEAAHSAGADLVKFQCWTPDTMCVDRAYTLERGPWKGRKLFDLYRECWTPWPWFKYLFFRARQLGMEPFAAAFDPEAVDFLETLDVKRHKVASFELVDLPLIRRMADTRKPIILSTGMASDEEITDAIAAAHPADVTTLCCVSAYPAQSSDYNLAPWSSLWPWGLSDHSPGIGVACAAVARGAVYVEKHFTLKRSDGGPDAAFSLEPAEFKQLVVECRRAAEAVDESHTGPKVGEDASLRRSLWVVRDTPAGADLVFGENVRTARPASGLPCGTDLKHKRATRNLRAGEPLTADCLK